MRISWLYGTYNKEYCVGILWLGLGAFTAVAWVQFLVQELRSCKPRGAAKEKRVLCMILSFINCMLHIFYIHTFLFQKPFVKHYSARCCLKDILQRDKVDCFQEQWVFRGWSMSARVGPNTYFRESYTEHPTIPFLLCFIFCEDTKV